VNSAKQSKTRGSLFFLIDAYLYKPNLFPFYWLINNVCFTELIEKYNIKMGNTILYEK